MREFFTAAKDTMDEVDVEGQVTIKLDGTEITFNKPSNGQFALMLAMSSRKMDLVQIGNFIGLLIELGDTDTQRYLQTRLMDSDDTFDIDSEGGILELWEALVEEWSARPTKQPSDYQPPRRSTGNASTARTRAKGSTSSRSRSTASSQ